MFRSVTNEVKGLAEKQFSEKTGFPKGWETQNRSSDCGLNRHLAELTEMQRHF